MDIEPKMTMEQIVAWATESFLVQKWAFRVHAIVEVDHTEQIIVEAAAEDISGVEESIRARFSMGRKVQQKLGRLGKLGKRKVTGVCEVARAQVQNYPHGTSDGAWVLVILSYSTRKRKHTVTVFEILRNNAGEVIDLLNTTPEDPEIQSVSIPAYLAGARTVKQRKSVALNAFLRKHEYDPCMWAHVSTHH